AIALRLEVLGLLDQTTAGGVGGEQLLDEGRRASAAPGQTLRHRVRLLPDELQVQHGRMLLRFGRGLLGFHARDRADLVVSLEVDDAPAPGVAALRGAAARVDPDELPLAGDG